MIFTIEKIEKYLEKATPGNWTGHMNYPFYAVIDKPAPSLSKHDSERPNYWKIDDVEFVLVMKNGGVQFLLDEIKRLKEIEAQYEGLCK
jgi:hypothetical protein